MCARPSSTSNPLAHAITFGGEGENRAADVNGMCVAASGAGKRDQRGQRGQQRRWVWAGLSIDICDDDRRGSLFFHPSHSIKHIVGVSVSSSTVKSFSCSSIGHRSTPSSMSLHRSTPPPPSLFSATAPPQHLRVSSATDSSSTIFLNLDRMRHALQSILVTIRDLPEPTVHYDDVKEQCLELQREFVFLANDRKDMNAAQRKTYAELSELYRTIDTYVTAEDRKHTNGHLKFLAYITATLTPMGVLVGYFGMNFADMGAPSNGCGAFSWRHGHFVVLGVMVAIVIVITYLYYFAKGRTTMSSSSAASAMAAPDDE